MQNAKTTSSVENKVGAAVATDHPICSQVGVTILREGGNAADAAIASTLCLGVVNPTSSGIGGGAFILVHSIARKANDMDSNGSGSSPPFEDARTRPDRLRDRNVVRDSIPTKSHSPTQNRKVTEFIDCRETAPKASTYDMYKSNSTLSTVGGLSVAIPGELRGLELLHSRFGKLPWSNLVRPAMELARDGFQVGPHLAKSIKEKEKYIRSMPNLGHLLTKNNDGVTLLKEGDTMVRSQYAKTLEAIMNGGGDVLYHGDIASMLAKVRAELDLFI